MESKMFIVVISSLSVFISLSQADPPCHAAEIWRCNDIAVEWFHTLPKRSIAVTKSEVEVMCQAWKKTFDCFSGWGRRCMSPMQREVATLMFEGSVEVQHALCTPGAPTYERYIKHAPCLNEVAHMDEFKSQLEYIVAVFHKSHHIPVKDMLTYGCCGVKKNCNSILKLVRQQCNDEAAEVVEEVKIMMLGLLTEAMCEDLDGTEKKCTDLLPPDGEKITSYEHSPFLKTLTHILKNWLDS